MEIAKYERDHSVIVGAAARIYHVAMSIQNGQKSSLRYVDSLSESSQLGHIHFGEEFNEMISQQWYKKLNKQYTLEQQCPR